MSFPTSALEVTALQNSCKLVYLGGYTERISVHDVKTAPNQIEYELMYPRSLQSFELMSI